MSAPLFDIPSLRFAEGPVSAGYPAGGFGAGHFLWTATGEFRGWRLHPGLPEQDAPAPANRFHLWLRQGRRTTTWTLSSASAAPYAWPADLSAPATQRRLFPFTWADYTPALPGNGAQPEIALEALAFSPLLPGSDLEASLPVYVIAWRAGNLSGAPLEAALMLTWACGWPEIPAESGFDFQHDNLCLTGALGDPSSPNRMAIAVPDLHHEGIYLQGIEPWDATGDGQSVREDFDGDGELDSALVEGRAPGGAAWVKFDLAPGEIKEIPFVLSWHFPRYESGPAAGQPRAYTRFLSKRRPDNAIVWLAEQAVENYGAETANYRYWIQQLADWQQAILTGVERLENPAKRINRLGTLLEADTVWTEDTRFHLLPTAGQTREELKERLQAAVPLTALWPDIARQI